jgi:RNA-directed DNA polymerase
MIKASIDLQDLRRRIYVKAKAEPSWRFWGLYVHVCKEETLREAYRLVKRNKGAPGIDGVTFETIETHGEESFLAELREELVTETYRPVRVRSVEIPKGNGKMRRLSSPTIRDRVVQGALKLILEPIFEADFQPGSFGYRPRKKPQEAIQRVSDAIIQEKTYVIDLDLQSYFDTVRHHIVLELLSNIYLNEVDKMLQRAKEATRYSRWTGVEYARFADDMVILVDAHPRHLWLRGAIQRRLREELAKIQVIVNEEKTHVVDLSRGESFGFLGFEFRRIRSRSGKWMPLRTPLPKARMSLLRRLKELFRRSRSQPTGGLIKALNPILRGWVQYFAIGHSSRCFSFVKDWVEKKIRRHLNRARLRPGFGWKRWSRQWIYDGLGLFDDYIVRRNVAKPKAAPA